MAGKGSHDQVRIFSQACHGQVGGDTPLLVQPLGIDDPARGYRHVVGRDMVDDLFCVATLQEKLGERGDVEQTYVFANSSMFQS